MKKLFIVANWKSNKTESETEEWFQKFSIFSPRGEAGNFQFSRQKEIIICPPFTLLSNIKSYILDNKLPFKLGAQDISPFTEGSYTGEISGKQIKEFADYVIIGHSERRENFSENDEVLAKKVAMAKQYSLFSIFCIQDEKTMIPKGAKIVAYEPPSAIGTARPDTPENADKIASIVKKKNSIQYVLYGGSVTADNVADFTHMSHLNGVLVGGASLNPLEFLAIIKNA